jgi:uncharacterized protein (TIGR02588 family)
MSISRFDGGASAAEEPAGRNGKAQSGARGQQAALAKAGSQGQPQAQATPFWEKVVGALGLVIVLGVVGFLLYEAVQPQTQAEIVAQVQSITPQAGGYLVEFEASNHGRQTAASVAIEGTLYDPSQPDRSVETAEVTFDYIPDRSGRTGSFVFEHDPRQYELRLQVKGFMDP